MRRFSFSFLSFYLEKIEKLFSFFTFHVDGKVKWSSRKFIERMDLLNVWGLVERGGVFYEVVDGI